MAMSKSQLHAVIHSLEKHWTIVWAFLWSRCFLFWLEQFGWRVESLTRRTWVFPLFFIRVCELFHDILHDWVTHLWKFLLLLFDLRANDLLFHSKCRWPRLWCQLSSAIFAICDQTLRALFDLVLLKLLEQLLVKDIVWLPDRYLVLTLLLKKSIVERLASLLPEVLKELVFV